MTDATYKAEPPPSLLVRDLPEHDRPRERLLRLGAEPLKDEELLAIILRAGPRGLSTIDLARDLLRRYDHNLALLANADPTELQRIHGIGQAKAAELKAAFTLAQRLATSMFHERPRLDSPEMAATFLRERFRAKAQEELHALLLDTRNRFLRDETITVGLVNQAQAHAREVFRAAIQQNACAILLSHNHPSGDPSPSAQDRTLTRQLVEAGKIVGIEVVDHLVMAVPSNDPSRDYYSFRENGLM